MDKKRIRILASIVAITLMTSFLQAQGEESKTQSPIKYLILVWQENHSYDNIMGKYPRGNGIPDGAKVPMNITKIGSEWIEPFDLGQDTSNRPDHKWNPQHEWDVMWKEYNNGSMNGFATYGKYREVMGYYLPPVVKNYWAYADQFVLADNWFSSCMCGSMPNSFYMVAVTSGGIVKNGWPSIMETNRTVYGKYDRNIPPQDMPTIIDRLADAGISWKWYQEGFPNNEKEYILHHNPLEYIPRIKNDPKLWSNVQDFTAFKDDIAKGTLPSISWIRGGVSHDEHPSYSNVTAGMLWVTDIVNTVMRSQYWKESAIVISYDESGGFYDHVAPPIIDKYGYGPRVPALIISPYAMKGYISHQQRDHTATLKFIEWNWNLKPLGYRDTVTANVLDAFDFKQIPREPYIIDGTRLPEGIGKGSTDQNIVLLIGIGLGGAVVGACLGYYFTRRADRLKHSSQHGASDSERPTHRNVTFTNPENPIPILIRWFKQIGHSF